MIKVLLIIIILVILRLLIWVGFKIVKVMASSNKEEKASTTTTKQEEYVPLEQENKNLASTSELDNNEFKISDTGFTDHTDNEFFDYSAHMRNRKSGGMPMDFDTQGEYADSFEYEPSSPEFDFLHKHAPKPKPKTLPQTLSDLPDEIKALMISGLFDPKFK